MITTRKAYTGGNVADVVKQLVCGRLMAHLSKTSRSPWSLCEFWSGPALHPLHEFGAPATTLNSHRYGASRVWRALKDLGEPTVEQPGHHRYWLDWYFRVLRKTNDEYRAALVARSPDGQLPREVAEADERGDLLAAPSMLQVARYFMGAHDQACFVEPNAEEHAGFAAHARGDKRFRSMQADPPSAMPVLLPTVSRRALVFLDPPPGRRDEDAAAAMLRAAVDRDSSSTYAMFYQLSERPEWNISAVRAFKRAGLHSTHAAELRFDEFGEHANDPHTGVAPAGCGVVFANVPYDVFEVTQDLGHTLHTLSSIIDRGADPVHRVYVHNADSTRMPAADDRVVDRIARYGLRWGTSPKQFTMNTLPQRRQRNINDSNFSRDVDKKVAAAWLDSRGMLRHFPDAHAENAATVGKWRRDRVVAARTAQLPEDLKLPDDPSLWPRDMRPTGAAGARSGGRTVPAFEASRRRLLAKRAATAARAAGGGREEIRAAVADATGAAADAADTAAESPRERLLREHRWRHMQLLRMRKRAAQEEAREIAIETLRAPGK